MPRPTWKGTLGFGLVQLLVELFPATQEDDLDFRMLDGRNLAPIGYQRVNKKTKKEVPFSEIVKGVEVKKGKYVVVTPADMKAAHPKATRSIDITDFVDGASISPMRWADSYFVAPATGASPKAYAVLRDALRASGKVGIAKVVLRSRQHLCAIAVEGDAIVLALLRFDTELRDASALESISKAADVKATKKELELAEKLIETLAGDFKPAQYHDEYQDALQAFVKKKIKQGAVGEVEPEDDVEEAKPARSNVIDLLAALKASLEKPRSKSTHAKKRATSEPTQRRAKPRKSPRSAARRRSPQLDSHSVALLPV